jgi:hypothetical protein
MSRSRRIVLALGGAISGMLLALVLLRPDILREKPRPRDARALAAWVATHPADWKASRALSEQALDSDLPRRLELWKASYDHARSLAPLRTQAATAFVRGGLFHWTELSPADRKAVLAAAAPLLRDEATFVQLHANLFQLTRDFNYVRRAAPDSPRALRQLRDLALAHGLFAEYRELRAEERETRVARLSAIRGTATVPELLSLLPHPADAADKPLIRDVLEATVARPVNAQRDGRVTSALTSALDLGIEPARTLAPLLDAEWISEAVRARLALALDDPAAATRLELAARGASGSDWAAYFADRARHEARRGERAAAEAALARLPAGDAESLAVAAGIHRIIGDETRAGELENRLRTNVRWAGLCGNDLCRSARTFRMFDTTPEALRFAVVQTDGIPPYLEVFVDGALVAEGAVEGSRTFEVLATPGIHEIEVRLVNPKTRSGLQRRVRMS